MKTICYVVLLAILGLFGLGSCSKKADDVTPNGQTTSSSQAGFRAKVDGTDYAPDLSYGLASFPGIDGYYAVYGLDSKTSNIVAIALPNAETEGTYKLNDVSLGIATVNKVDYTTVNAGGGTVTITKKTATNIMGTFSFTAYDATGTKKLTLTEGTFNVPVK